MSRGPDLLLVSGPSCAGKSPLCDATKAAHPDLFEGRRELVLYHSRGRRAHETDGEDYFFRTRERIEALGQRDDHLLWEVRQDLQALELAQLDEALDEGRAYHEGNFRVALDLQARYPRRSLSVFVSPLTGEEVERWRRAEDRPFTSRLTEMMRRRLMRRTRAQQADLALSDLRSIEARAADAIEGLRRAHRFDRVLPNHDGEDSDHWRLGPEPIGDAGLAVQALAAAMRGEDHPRLERWEPGLVGMP